MPNRLHGHLLPGKIVIVLEGNQRVVTFSVAMAVDVNLQMRQNDVLSLSRDVKISHEFPPQILVLMNMCD